MALDQGTTSSRTILFNQQGKVCAVAQKEFKQYFPKPGWVEHNPSEIWSSQAATAAEVLRMLNISAEDIAGIGIANQRETTIVWDAETSAQICNAIVWQDRRTADYCNSLIEQGYTDMIREKTGLIIDSYFSGTKIRWILENVPGARKKAEAGRLRFGTVDTWLVWKLTHGQVYVTDVTNASRTMLFNIHSLQWDKEILELLGIPESMLPEVRQSSEVYGNTVTKLFSDPIPICGMAGDQQAALFGQMCTEPGAVKNTYGTGCFLLMNTGQNIVKSNNNLLTTIAWKINDQVCYALEGSIFVGGSVIQWLRDGLKILESSAQSEELALSVGDNDGVYFVPALTGLGAPYWDSFAKGTITGITRGTTAAHIARAALEGIAFQTMDIVNAMQKDAGVELTDLKVDGGASRNNYLMQFQSDVLNTTVIRPKCVETTAKGAAYLAGLAIGFWENIDDIKSQWSVDSTFTPRAPREKVSQLIAGWEDAVGRTLTPNR